MFKSIFSKYFSVISTVVIVSFLALGGVQVAMTSNYWKAEKREGLSHSAAYAADMTAVSLGLGGDSHYYLSKSRVTVLLYAITHLSNYDILLADGDGTILLCSFTQPNAMKEGDTLEEPLMQQLTALGTQEELYLEGTLGNLFSQKKLTVGKPVVKNGTVVAYVLVSANGRELLEYLMDNIRMYLLAALGVLLVAFIVSYLLTYRMVQPLREMSAAARCFGNGDFSRRVHVSGKDEVAQLAESLNAMAISLSAEEDVRRSFVANVSHELKTPMTTIAGFIDGILDGTIPADRRDRYLKIVSDEVRRLSRLVKAMLDLSRIDSGQMKLSPVSFDLTESVGHALLSLVPKIEEKQLRVTGLEDCPPIPATGDYDLIGQVVYNLVENAVKFTPVGGEIHFAFEQRDGRVYCRIRNTGEGISAEEMPHIFERFYKSDRSRSQDKTGLGLGLFLVRSILNLHGGEILVRSVQGEFCEFEFWLPAATESGGKR